MRSDRIWKLFKLSVVLLGLWSLPAPKADALFCGEGTLCSYGCPMEWKCDYSTCSCIPCDGPQDPDPACGGHW